MNARQLIIATVLLLLTAIGLGIYAWRVQKRAGIPAPASYAGPVAPPTSGPTEQVTLYVADDASGTIQPQPASIPLPQDRQQRAREIIRALMGVYLSKSSTHPITPGSDIRDVYLINPGLAVLDMNSTFADGHRSGVLVEDLTIASLVKTISENVPGILRVQILVNGQERDTLAGHADLSGFYDVAAVNQMFGQMQTSQR
jgi:hypothetical protein